VLRAVARMAKDRDSRYCGRAMERTELMAMPMLPRVIALSGRVSSVAHGKDTLHVPVVFPNGLVDAFLLVM